MKSLPPARHPAAGVLCVDWSLRPPLLAQPTAHPNPPTTPGAGPSQPAPEDETELEQTGPELVFLDEVEAGEAEKDLPIDDDIDVGDAADDTFLEEEEEGEDDVADLIDGDIEDDEEA